MSYITDKENRRRIKSVLSDVRAERLRQDSEYGLPDNLPPGRWMEILMEEVGEVARARNDHLDYQDWRAEMIQVAAVAVRSVQAMDDYFLYHFNEEQTSVPPEAPLNTGYDDSLDIILGDTFALKSIYGPDAGRHGDVTSIERDSAGRKIRYHILFPFPLGVKVFSHEDLLSGTFLERV